jgi:hypothetical protein
MTDRWKAMRLDKRIDTPATLHLLFVEGFGMVLESITWDPLHVDGIGMTAMHCNYLGPGMVTADTLGVTVPAAGGGDDVTPPV